MIFFIFINMGPYGSDNFKTLLLPQLWIFINQTFSKLSCDYNSCLLEILNLKVFKKDLNFC